MAKDKIYLVRKYAFLLVCFYVVETVGSHILSGHQGSPESTNELIGNLFIYSGTFYLLSIIMAIFVYSDIKSLHLHTKYSVFCTVVFAPMGVCLFLLYVILAEVKKNDEAAHRHPKWTDQQ